MLRPRHREREPPQCLMAFEEGTTGICQGRGMMGLQAAFPESLAPFPSFQENPLHALHLLFIYPAPRDPVPA